MTSTAEADLNRALLENRPECEGLELFTAEGLKPADVAVCRDICNQCPLFDVCRAYAQHTRPEAGVWAGRLYGGTRARDQTEDPIDA
jgi:hypothetical protein